MGDPAVGDRIHWVWTTGDPGPLPHESCFLSEPLFSDLSTYDLHVAEEPVPQSAEIVEMDFELAACDLRDAMLGYEDPRTVLPKSIVRSLQKHAVPQDSWFDALFSADLTDEILTEHAHLVYAQLQTGQSAMFDTANSFLNDERTTRKDHTALSTDRFESEYSGPLYSYGYNGEFSHAIPILERRSPISIAWDTTASKTLSDGTVHVQKEMERNGWELLDQTADRYMLLPKSGGNADSPVGVRASQPALQLVEPVEKSTGRWHMRLYSIPDQMDVKTEWVAQTHWDPRVHGILNPASNPKFATATSRIDQIWDDMYTTTGVKLDHGELFNSSDDMLRVVRQTSRI